MKDWPGFQGVSHVLCADFLPSGELPNPDPQVLAKGAVASVAKARPRRDCISYLMQLSESGVETALTAEYRAEVLRLTGADSLAAALNHLCDRRRRQG